jgi:hypothetical protein
MATRTFFFAVFFLSTFSAAETIGGSAPALRRLDDGAGLPKIAAPARPAGSGGGAITIYVYPPSNIIDWSTPKTALGGFMSSALAGELAGGADVEVISTFGEADTVPSNYKSAMGHTIAHVRCAASGGRPYESWTSFSGQDFQEVDKGLLLDRKIGLGTLFYDYIDGHIISGDGNKARLFYYKGKDGNAPRYLSQRIDAAACGKVRDMIEFFKSFHYPQTSTLQDLQNRPPERMLYFTSNMDPYESYIKRITTGHGKVGGGCAPYGLALLKAAGKYDKALDPVFLLRLRVSERFIGGLPDGNGGMREVPVSDILGPLGNSWTHQGYKNRYFRNYDPYRIWKFIGEARACLSSSPGCSPAAAAWLDRHKGLIAAGEPREFNNTVSRVLVNGIEAQ